MSTRCPAQVKSTLLTAKRVAGQPPVSDTVKSWWRNGVGSVTIFPRSEQSDRSFVRQEREREQSERDEDGDDDARGAARGAVCGPAEGERPAGGGREHVHRLQHVAVRGRV